MCVALPMKVLEVVDWSAKTVRIAPDAAIAHDRAGADIVSAVLLAETDDSLRALVGAWVIVHGGFILLRLDDEDARSRVALFVAMDS